MVDFSLQSSDAENLADCDYIGHGRAGGYAEFRTVSTPVPSSRVPFVSSTELSELQRAQTEFTAKQYVGRLVVVPDAKSEAPGRLTTG